MKGKPGGLVSRGGPKFRGEGAKILAGGAINPSDAMTQYSNYSC